MGGCNVSVAIVYQSCTLTGFLVSYTCRFQGENVLMDRFLENAVNSKPLLAPKVRFTSLHNSESN
jgi:hypothetical protein